MAHPPQLDQPSGRSKYDLEHILHIAHTLGGTIETALVQAPKEAAMPKFILAYHGGPKSMSKEEGAAHMAKWKAWMGSLGDAVIDPGTPVGPSKTVSADGVSDGGGSNPLSGITIVQADTMDAALKMAKASPHLDIGGTIEVAEAMNMKM